jgi:dihydroorotase
MQYVDTHVHLRDFRQKHKETVKHGLEVARDAGVIAVFDMPNTDPVMDNEETITLREQLVREAGVPEVAYFCYGGLTANKEQVKRIVDVYRRKRSFVVGLKKFWGHSVGTLGIIRPDDQYMVMETLAQEGFDGVLVNHAEKESTMHHDRFVAAMPPSHCIARPAEAEVDSIRDIIAMAYMTRFPGKLHIAHISTPEGVRYVNAAKDAGMDVSCGVCPHHFIYDWNQMYDENGLFWKMNPPLRAPGEPQQMLEYLREGKIDWIETDHAPHSLEEKTAHPFMSGIPGLAWWDLYAEFLRLNDFSDKRIEEVTSTNAMARFGMEFSTTERPRVDRRNDYPFNPYTPLERRLGLTD